VHATDNLSTRPNPAVVFNDRLLICQVVFLPEQANDDIVSNNGAFTDVKGSHQGHIFPYVDFGLQRDLADDAYVLA